MYDRDPTHECETNLAKVRPCGAGPAGRYALLDKAVQERYQLLSYHAEFPGLMHIDNSGANFRTFPFQYEGSSQAMAVCMSDE